MYSIWPGGKRETNAKRKFNILYITYKIIRRGDNLNQLIFVTSRALKLVNIKIREIFKRKNARKKWRRKMEKANCCIRRILYLSQLLYNLQNVLLFSIIKFRLLVRWCYACSAQLHHSFITIYYTIITEAAFTL